MKDLDLNNNLDENIYKDNKNINNIANEFINTDQHINSNIMENESNIININNNSLIKKNS